LDDAKIRLSSAVQIEDRQIGFAIAIEIKWRVMRNRARTGEAIGDSQIIDVLTFSKATDIRRNPESKTNVLPRRSRREFCTRGDEFRNLIRTASSGPSETAGKRIHAAAIDRAVVSTR
jgi:hypothetical protein